MSLKKGSMRFKMLDNIDNPCRYQVIDRETGDMRFDDTKLEMFKSVHLFLNIMGHNCKVIDRVKNSEVYHG